MKSILATVFAVFAIVALVYQPAGCVDVTGYTGTIPTNIADLISAYTGSVNKATSVVTVTQTTHSGSSSVAAFSMTSFIAVGIAAILSRQ